MTSLETPPSPAAPKNLYLYTLATFRELIVSVLKTARATNIVEIGSEYGGFTTVLCDYARESGGKLISIDPAPQASAMEYIEANSREPHFQFIQKTSHDALPEVTGAAYIVDGDHNYYTVRRELELIDEFRSGPFLAILHDVCWPCGRRDMYYNPAGIPEEQRQPYSHDAGIAFGNPGVAEVGLRGSENFAFALNEGGPRNGVRTAVEDFLKTQPDLEFIVVPGVLGVGVIYDRTASWGKEVSLLLRPFDSHPLLERMEANRLELFFRVLELENEIRLLSETASHRESIRLPQTPGALRLVAQGLLQESDWAGAGIVLQSLARHFPHERDIWRDRLTCARMQDHKTHARLLLSDALRLHPEWAKDLSEQKTTPDEQGACEDHVDEFECVEGR